MKKLPKDTPRRLFISFSGGETSAYMTHWCLENWRDKYDDIRIVFANTGQEREETLEFVEKCDRHFGWGVVWVEAFVHHGKRKSPTHTIVSFETASRNGEPFEEVIKKYGIPNQGTPHCTRDLKLRPMKAYLRSIGWKPKSYDVAIGIRVDEKRRVRVKAMKEERFLYPFVFENPTTKPEVNEFWRSQPFRLKLKGYQGNCKWCWKKSLRKHLTLLNEDESLYDFPERMERLYGKPKDEKSEKYGEDYRFSFFRKNLTTIDLKQLAKTKEFTPFHDDADIYPEDTVDGHELEVIFEDCSEHCEIYPTEQSDSEFEFS